MDVELVDPQTHPLLVDVILDNLFELCNLEILCTCREVCKMWCTVAEKHWWKKGRVWRFRKNYYNDDEDDDDDDNDDGDDHDDPVINDASPIMNEVDHWKEIRYKKFRFDEFRFGSNWNVCNTFWMHQGKTMTHLTLFDTDIISAKAFRGLISCQCTPLLQNLYLFFVRYPFIGDEKNKCLLDIDIKNEVKSMRTLKITYAESFQNIPCSWDIVFKNFTELQTLSLNGYGTDENCELTRVLQGITNFSLTNGCCHPLKRLDIGKVAWCDIRVSFPGGMLKFIRENTCKTKKKQNKPNKDCGAALQLDTLSFSVENPLDALTLIEVVDYQSKQLKRLRLSGNIPSATSERFLIPSEHFTLPTLQCLTRLDLWECPVANLKFLIFCPKLRILNIILLVSTIRESEKRNVIQGIAPGWGSQEKKDLILPSLVSFHCNMLMDWDMNDMQQLISWAPNINSLLIQSSNASFPALCQGYPRLKRLLLYNNEVSDEVFTGLPKLRPRRTFAPVVAAVAAACKKTATFERRPNITDLKELEILGVMHNISEDDDPYVKDYAFHNTLTLFSATHGLLQMPHLKTLYLYKGINDAGLNAIENDDDFADKLPPDRKYNPNLFVVEFTMRF